MFVGFKFYYLFYEVFFLENPALMQLQGMRTKVPATSKGWVK